MTYLTAALSGLALLVIVDLVGALLSRSLNFNYAYLMLVSFAFALSPLVFTDSQTSAAQAAVFSLIIYGPESLFGLFLAYRINPYAGNRNYKETVDRTGFATSYVMCLVMWAALAASVYAMK